jgi:hypothetical protein
MPPLPPLPAEGHRCAECGVSYPDLGLDGAATIISGVPARAAGRCRPVPGARLRVRPDPAAWSALEYLCHLRDVYATCTIRLYRVRVEELPVLEPMLNDLRARRFRYNELDPIAVLDELARTAAGFLDEIDRMPADGWHRGATRLPAEWRTARWLVRHTAHEGVHHLADIRRVLGADQRSASRR